MDTAQIVTLVSALAALLTAAGAFWRQLRHERTPHLPAPPGSVKTPPAPPGGPPAAPPGAG